VTSSQNIRLYTASGGHDLRAVVKGGEKGNND